MTDDSSLRARWTAAKERLADAADRAKAQWAGRIGTLDRDEVEKRLAKIDAAFLDDKAQDVSDDDIERVVAKADRIEERFRESDGPLGRFLDDGRLMLHLVRDAWQGRYREVPRWTLGAVAFVLLYVLNPLDLIPDALPVIGVIDDAAVVSLALLMLEQDLQAYRRWRRALPASDNDPIPESSA